MDRGLGNGRLISGAGRDKVVLRAGDGLDTILQFEVGRDSFLFDDLTFNDLNLRGVQGKLELQTVGNGLQP